MEVFDAERGSRYGGNIRTYAARAGIRPVSKSVGRLLAHEEKVGLYRPETWTIWKKRVEENRYRFMEFMYDAKRKGKRLVGNSCPGRAATLLHYYGIDTALMPYVAELPNGLKVGKYLPGKHIPVVSNEILFKEQPEYVVLLAWHYSAYMIKDLRARGLKSRFVVPLPEFTVVS